MAVSRAALDAAQEHCRRVAAEHGRTYYLATALLPRATRPHVWALYAFARAADDLVDGPGPAPRSALAQWRSQSVAAMHAPSAPVSTGPVALATWVTMRHYDLAPSLWEEFADSMEMDLDVSRYRTWEELRGYMRGSAAVIGELMAPVLGARGGEALWHAARLGEAFQLTNFVRDVADDWHRGRVYLPLEDLAATGVTEAALADAVSGGRPSREVRELVLLEVERALGLYAAARPGLAHVARDARACLATAYDLYRDIAVRARRADGDVFSGRVVVPAWRRVLGAGRALTVNPAWARGVATARR